MEDKSPATNSEITTSEPKKPIPQPSTKRIPSSLKPRPVGSALKQSNSVIGSTTISNTPTQNSPTSRTSRIPTREKSTLSSRNIGKVPPPEKRFSLRKKSKTSLEVTPKAVSRQKTSISSGLTTHQASPRPPQSSRPSRTSHSSPPRVVPRTVNSTPTTPKTIKPKSPNHPSTSTLGNASHGNHRVGEVPSYLKKSEKTVTETALNTKKRTFNIQKKKLTDLQTEFLNSYKSLQELQCKYNKCTGKTNKVEDVKFVALVDGESSGLMIRDGDKTLKLIGSSIRQRSQSPPKVQPLFDIEKFRTKLLLIQEAGFKLCQELVDNFDKMQSETAEVPEVGDGTTLQKQIVQILKLMEGKIINEENEQKKLVTEVILELQNAVSRKHGDAGDNELAPTEEQLKTLKEKELEISNLTKQIEEFKKKLEISDSKLKEIESSGSDVTKALKRQIGNYESLIAEKDKEILWVKENLKKTEDLYRKEEKKSLAISSDLSTKESILQKLEVDLEELKRRNKGYENIIDEVKRQKEGILDVIRKEQESRKLYEKECETRQKLEADLQEKDNTIKKLRELSRKSMVDKETSILGGGDRSSYETKLYNEVQALRVTVERLTKEKSSLEKEKEELTKTLNNYGREDLKLQLAKASEEIKHLNTQNACLRDSVNRLESAISKKVGIINELERKISNGQYLVNASKELQNEINNLRESENEKKREIDALKSELSKAHVEIKQQEETICMNQRLLRIRSELINSLQEKEASNRCRMDDLYSEISKKTSLVNQMNHEISAKAEELQNLFSTLGTKQLEVNRQEHIIKMLEENNERNQRLRVKQEDRIARLESENSELKHLLSKYDAELDEDISSHTDKSPPNSPRYTVKATKDEENVSTRDLYDYERRKKRRTEIEVKKIRK